MFELNDVSNDNGNVVFEANETAVKRKDVRGTTRRARTTEDNLHAASKKCLCCAAINQP